MKSDSEVGGNVMRGNARGKGWIEIKEARVPFSGRDASSGDGAPLAGSELVGQQRAEESPQLGISITCRP